MSQADISTMMDIYTEVSEEKKKSNDKSGGKDYNIHIKILRCIFVNDEKFG